MRFPTSIAIALPLLLAPDLAGAQSPCSVSTKIVPTVLPTRSFGYSVALDQGRLLVGATGQGGSPGRAFLFAQGPGGWTLVEDWAGGNIGRFGSAVTLDGDTAIVGAPSEESVPGLYGGAVHVFRENGGWTEEATLVPNDIAEFDGFGGDVALDGNRLMVASPTDNTTNGISSGSVVFFLRTPSGWIQGQKLKPSDGIGQMRFGTSIALDGDRLVASAPFDHPQGVPDAGSVYVFEFDGAKWNETAKITAPELGLNDEFGERIALDGDRLAITGLVPATFGPPGTYLFQVVGGTWTLETLLPKAATGDVAIDGDRVLLGRRGQDVAHDLYRLSNGSWAIEQSFVFPPSDPGVAVALDGSLVAVGAEGDDQVAINAGAVYVEELAAMPSTYCTAKTTSNGCVPVIDSAGAPSANGLTPFPISAREVPNQKPGLLFYGRSGPAALPFLGGTLCVLPPLVRTAVQTSGGNPPPADCSGAYLVDFATIAPGDPNLAPGDAVHAQYWFRDPAHPDGTGVALSDALSFELCD